MNFAMLSLLWTIGIAAVPQQNLDESIIHSLREPHKQAVQSLQNLGPEGRKRLKEIAFDENIPMGTRWNAFMALSHLEGSKSLASINEALQHNTWFMRSAGLTALRVLDLKKAKESATKILKSDPALLVRMKAIEVLSESKDEKITELFWEKLNANDSFHLNKSLWIREDITKLLMRNPRKKDLTRWVQLLHDREEKFQSMAVVAIAKITNSEKATIGSDLTYWQRRYPASSKSIVK